MPYRAGALSPGNLGTLLGDVALGLAGLYLAFWIRIALPLPGTFELLPPERFLFFGQLWPWLLVTQPLFLYLFGFYHPRAERPRLELARSVAFAVGAETLALGAGLFFLDRPFPRSVLVLFALLEIPLLTFWRAFLQRLDRVPKRRVVVVGAGPAAAEVARKIREHHAHGLFVHGHLPIAALAGGTGAADDAGDPDPALGARLRDLDELARLHAAGEIHDLILAPDPGGWQTTLLDRLGGEGRRGPALLLLPGPFESLIGAMRYRWVNDLPLIEVTRDADAGPAPPFKRIVDLSGATLLLVLGAPAMLCAALAVRLSSPGPVLFRQERVGRNFRPFEVWKFRTMRADAERETGEVLATPNDPRLTPVGGFLRRSRLDELPQLWNVLVGEMSLVGPRPERPGFVRRHLEEVPGYAGRFVATPGLTGLAQVNGEYRSTPENKLRYDLAYIANRSLWLDLSILLRTVRIVLTSQGI
jgi:exopolysaccharide biosynthesis polyprenyl glycosylphosphotransferase